MSTGLALVQAAYAVPLAVAGVELVVRAGRRAGAPWAATVALSAAWALTVWVAVLALTAAAIG